VLGRLSTEGVPRHHESGQIRVNALVVLNGGIRSRLDRGPSQPACTEQAATPDVVHGYGQPRQPPKGHVSRTVRRSCSPNSW
jgi:hypothetical protein